MITIGEKDRTILLWSIEGEANVNFLSKSTELDDSMTKKEAIDNKLKLLEMPVFTAKKTGVEKFGKALKGGGSEF